MNALFWILWIIDIFLLLLVIAGANFRSGFGAGVDFNTIATVGMVILVVAAFLLKLMTKHRWWPLILAAMPLVILLLMYINDKVTKG
jgi:hypothetical protein